MNPYKISISLILLVGIIISPGLSTQMNTDSIVLALKAYIDSTESQQELSKIHIDGLLTKRILVFNKRIGGFYSNLEYLNTNIFSFENQYQFKRKTEIHYNKYYFRDNSLIAYYESIRDVNGLRYQVASFFSDNALITAIVEVDTDDLKFNDLKVQQVSSKAVEALEYWQNVLSDWNK